MLSTAGGMENGALWKMFWQFLKRLNVELPYFPAILLLGIDPRRLKTCPRKNLIMNIHSSITYNSPKNGNHPNVHQLTSR